MLNRQQAAIGTEAWPVQGPAALCWHAALSHPAKQAHIPSLPRPKHCLKAPAASQPGPVVASSFTAMQALSFRVGVAAGRALNVGA